MSLNTLAGAVEEAGALMGYISAARCTECGHQARTSFSGFGVKGRDVEWNQRLEGVKDVAGWDVASVGLQGTHSRAQSDLFGNGVGRDRRERLQCNGRGVAGSLEGHSDGRVWWIAVGGHGVDGLRGWR